MSTYYLKYYAEVQNFRGQLTRVEIHQRNTPPSSVLQIGDVCGLVLELQGGQDEVFMPILKTQARLSMISNDDKPTADGVKYGDWGEFYTPDSTLYKVIIKTKATASSSSWETRWTGYITPDSWQEGLEYGSAITITARDNIGHLQDFEFSENHPTGVDEYGLISIRALINYAMDLIEMPMAFEINTTPGDIVGGGTSILDSLVSVQKFDDSDWYQVLDNVLDAIGYCLRYTDQNRLTLAPIRHLPLVGGTTQQTPVMLEFYGGDGAVVPAVKRVIEEHEYGYEAESDLSVNDDASVGDTNPYTYKCFVNIKNRNLVSRFPIYHDDAPYAKVVDPGSTLWKSGTDSWKPGPASSLMSMLEGDGWDNCMFLAANGLDGQMNESEGTDLRTQSLRFHCGTPDVTLRLYFFRTPVTIAHWGTDWEPLPPPEWDGVVPMDEPFFGKAGLYKIRYTIKMEHGNDVFYWDDGSWKATEAVNEQEFDPVVQTTDVEIPLAANTDVEDDVFITLNIVHIEYMMTGIRALDVLPTSTSSLKGCYARLSNATVEVNQANLAKNTVRTFNDEKNNVIIKRTPEVSPLSRDVKIAIPASYEDALFYYPTGEDFPKPFPYLVNWDTVSGSNTKPLPVLIHQQLLCYRGASLWELNGECAPKAHALFRFDRLVKYKQRTYLIQSGTIDFLTGTVSSALLKEFLNYDDLWDDTEQGDWEDEGIYNTIGGGPTGGGSGHSGSSGGSGSQGTAHTHDNKALLDKLGEQDGYLFIGDVKVKAGEADHAAEADHADNSDEWDGHEFDDYLDQPVRTTDDVQFRSVTAGNVTGSTKVVTPDLESPDFSSGPLGAGFRLRKVAGGNATLELDELTVRKSMRVYELIIQQIKHQGGMVIYSAASMVCSRVEELENGYKCYFDTMENEQGDAQVPNEFVVGDQARCQRFDLAATNAKYYWRLVTAVGDDYIVLSKTDCDAGSGVPAVGDNIVQVGNRTDTARQSAKVTTCIDSQSPRDDYYKGINSYDLTGKLITTVGVKDNQVGVWTKNGSFEGVVTISGGSGLQNLDEWAAVSESITNAQTAANKALAAIADINSDSVLDPSEKNTIRTDWITINGTEALDRVGARGSYSITKALFEKYKNLGGQIRLDYDGHVYTRDGVVYTYSAVGVSALDAAYLALREYLAQVQLNNRVDSYDGFDRSHYSELLTTYYNAELFVNDQINQAIEKEIKDTKADLLADLGEFQTAVEASLEEMQGIIDNTIDTWFYNGEPTLNNLPASEWTTETLKERHLGDLYYDNETGLAYRFQRSGTEGSYTYSWNLIPDSAVAEALAAAAAAQDTADHKRRVFRAQPTNSDAYDPGDVWLHATYGTTYNDEMLVCKTAKAAGVAFSIAHWETATKYTDDTVANQAVLDAAAAQSTADQAVLDAAAAQQAADNAQADASAANTRLNNWASDSKISPTEKTALKQQQKDIQTEYTEIIANATRYSVTTTTYASAYTAANTALTKYTAGTPENITVESDYANIAAYYDARNTILQAIAAAAKKVADDAQDAADAAQTAADAAQDAADAAQSAADAAQDAADAAQSTADSAYSIATAARDRLANWASDSYISPQEKTALKQQQSDIQTEYTEIIADATRYGVSSTAYAAAYTAANTALNKYTAASPENITVTSDYDDIANYYLARTTILQAIAAAAKKVATDAQAAADKANAAIADINSDSVLDPSEKAAVKTTWVSINGNESLSNVGADGTYYAAKRMIQELKETEMSTKLVYGSSSKKVYTYNGLSLTYGNYGEAQLDAAYLALREFLRHCELQVEGPCYGFSRSQYAAKIRDYDTALVNVQRLYTDNAKQTAEETSMDSIAKNLGYTSYEEMVSAALGGNTIIDGGYIRTDLINVATLIAKRLSTTDENSLKSLTIQDNQIKLYDSNGALRTHIHANALSTPATNTQEVFNPGALTFTGLNMVDEVISGSASLFNFVTGSGNDTIQGSGQITVVFNLTLYLQPKSFADFDVDLTVKLKINGTTWKSNTTSVEVVAGGSHASIHGTLYLDPTTAKTLGSAGAKNVSIEFVVEPQHGLASLTSSVSGSVTFSGVSYTVTHVTSTPQITEVGTDGIQVVRSSSEYAQLHESSGHLEFKIISGSYGLRVNSSGIQKTTDGGSSWSSI